MIQKESPSLAGSAAYRALPAPEQLLLDILDTVREPLLVLDDELRVTQANRAFLKTFHVGHKDTIGELLFALGNGQWDIPQVRAMLLDRLAIEPELHDVDVDHVFPGIGRKIMLLNARVVSHHAHASRVILLAIEDVTERRTIEAKLAAQHKELQRSNAALNEFAFVASHDLQEPLRKILSFGERLEASAGPLLEGNPQLYLSRMLSAAARMRTLIIDLLTYSQIHRSVEPFVQTDLAAVAREVVTDLETTIADCGGRVEIGALPTIEADAPQMRQLMQNLVSNALKFRCRDSPPVVRIDAGAARDGSCVISVSDNGIGFKQEYGEKIFRMFERLNSRSQYDGSGIGLALCRRIVERHGGKIAGTSTTGGGAVFSVTLPLTQAEAGYPT